MEKHPDWTPVSNPPTSSDVYLVSTERGVKTAAYVVYRRMWIDGDCNMTESVRAWMPLPPDYEPPKPVVLEWHDGDEKPDYPGTYVVRKKLNDGVEVTACAHYDHGWKLDEIFQLRGKIIAWMPIPQVPTEILLRH